MTDSRIAKMPFNAKAIREQSLTEPMLDNWPVVYTINNAQEIYVGETTNLAIRMKQHLDSGKREQLKHVNVVLNSTFNKSACLDLEAHLIRYFFADEKYKVLNGNSGIVDSDYFSRDEYRVSFDAIFEQLVADGTLSRSIPELINSDLFKYSPFKSLNAGQAIAVQDILEKLVEALARGVSAPFTVQGSPGTGKTIVAIYLLKLITDIQRGEVAELSDSDPVFADLFQGVNRSALMKLKNFALVIPQQSLRASIKKVFKKTPGLNAKTVISPYELASNPGKYDLVVVDEAHRLQRRANQSSPALNKKFRDSNVRLYGSDDKTKTQLDWVYTKSRHQILLVDPDQAVKPADLSRENLDELIEASKKSFNHFYLENQMRVEGGNRYIEYVRDLMAGKAAAAPDFGQYDFRHFTSLGEMREEVLALNEKHGLARVVAGYAWPWLSKGNKPTPDIRIENLELFWNRTPTDWINSKDSHLDVGSIHTVQGYDLNYAGVIIGGDISYDPTTKKMVFHRENYFDVKGKENNPTLGLNFNDEDVLEYVTNIYRVLLTRGIKGTFIYAVDENLRNYLAERLRTV